MRILFHAINGFGTGHVVRLSHIANAIKARNSGDVLHMVTSCKAASAYFESCCECIPCDLASPAEHGEQVRRVVDEFYPDVVVFDTRWPKSLPEYLVQKGVRTVLILRARRAESMRHVASQATTEFETILLPHIWDEVEYLYGGDTSLMRMLSKAPFAAVGPIARVNSSRTLNGAVIFTLGAGNPYDTNVNSYIRLFIRTADLLFQYGYKDQRFLAGPLLEKTMTLGPLKVLRDARAHEFFGPTVTVVSRGGYNTCWEAIGAKSSLVIAPAYTLAEDLTQRTEYFEERGFARGSTLTPQSITDAIILGRPTNIEHGSSLVNSGLGDAVRMIMGT